MTHYNHFESYIASFKDGDFIPVVSEHGVECDVQFYCEEKDVVKFNTIEGSGVYIRRGNEKVKMEIVTKEQLVALFNEDRLEMTKYIFPVRYKVIHS